MSNGNWLKSAHFVEWVTKERYGLVATLYIVLFILALNPLKESELFIYELLTMSPVAA
jgi:hypothetical protein